MLSVSEQRIGNFNFAMPPVIAAEFRRIGDVHGERNKLRWAVAAAAVLKLLEMPPAEMEELIVQVAGAKTLEHRLRQMVADAKAKASGGLSRRKSKGKSGGEGHAPVSSRLKGELQPSRPGVGDRTADGEFRYQE